tara:strand:- start:8 stop:1216 length:1209 start_codon:yes stop_codon:yes gene_type:complete
MIKVLHVVGGSSKNGAFKGAYILHKALLDLNIDSKVINDLEDKNTNQNLEKGIIYAYKSFFDELSFKVKIFIEKTIKTFFLPSPRETFTLSFFGLDVTKLEEYKNADIIHFHWLNQGFISLKSLSKINKPAVWTMRDMWVFTGGSHYSMDFERYENSYLSNFVKKFKKKVFKDNFQFIAVSNWIKDKAKNSIVLKNREVIKIDNNIEIKDFRVIDKAEARNFLGILTEKKVILYGAQNPQSKRKGWDVFVETLKILDKSNYYLLIFGNFWSQKILDDIGLEYKNLGYIDDQNKLNNIYSSSDIFVGSSLQDAWPKTFAEAMLCGTPVVCFNNTSISEVVDHKKNGYVVENIQPHELKNGIEWLATNNEDKKLSNNARQKIFEFDSKKIAKKYIDLYMNILKK